MGAKKLRTIEEENEIRTAFPVVMFILNAEPHYTRTGIASPFGGEILEEVALHHYGGGIPIKCSETGRLGTMQTDNTPREVIQDISWDERESGV